MHYSATAFGRGKKTIISKTGATLGQRNGFSSSDLVGINKLYCDGDVTKPKCEDKNVGCSGWAKAGYCESGDYIELLADLCKKSCGLCGGK